MRSTDYMAPFISQELAVIGAFQSSHWAIVAASSCSLSGLLLYCFPVFFYHGHPCFRNFNSTIPVDVIRVKSVRISINKLVLVPNQIVASHMGMFSLLIEILACTHVGSRKLSTQDFIPITSTGIVELKFPKHGCT